MHRNHVLGAVAAAALLASVPFVAGATGGADAHAGAAARRGAPPAMLVARTGTVEPGAVDPGDFGAPRRNAYFPLDPGLTTILRGRDEGERLRERVVVTGRTRTIQGVRTRVVSDVVRRADGSLAERTTDWYAADDEGNVWYFGEDTATYDRHGRLDSREGSWEAGRDGAVAGIVMPAQPRPATAYRQEYWRGHAEDQAWIVAVRGAVRVPAGRFRDVVRSFEWSRLEPRVVSLKLYAPGVGIVRERDVSGGAERFELVAVRR